LKQRKASEIQPHIYKVGWGF